MENASDSLVDTPVSASVPASDQASESSPSQPEETSSSKGAVVRGSLQYMLENETLTVYASEADEQNLSNVNVLCVVMASGDETVLKTSIDETTGKSTANFTVNGTEIINASARQGEDGKLAVTFTMFGLPAVTKKEEEEAEPKKEEGGSEEAEKADAEPKKEEGSEKADEEEAPPKKKTKMDEGSEKSDEGVA